MLSQKAAAPVEIPKTILCLRGVDTSPTRRLWAPFLNRGLLVLSDLNPDERVWGYLKGAFRRAPLPAEANFEAEVTCAMKTLRNDRAKVRTVYGHPAVAYVREALNW